MDNRYLSKAKIEELLNYLNTNLTTKTRVILLKLKNDHNISLMSDQKNNMQALWTLALSEINDKADWKNKMLTASNKDSFIGSGQVIREYLNVYYTSEWSFAQNFNYDSIQFWITTFCNENYVQVLQINELLECKSYEDLLNSKYSLKFVSKESKDNTAKFKNAIDNIYKDYAFNSNEFYCVHNALQDYIMSTTKDEHRLHNMLNTVVKW
jgi:hypothetical protein